MLHSVIHDVFTQQTEGLNIAWVQNGKVLEAETKKTLKRDIAKVLEKATFSCNVSNKVSSRASEPKTQTCIKPGEYHPVGSTATCLLYDRLLQNNIDKNCAVLNIYINKYI